MKPADTKERIFDAAERLFVERGFAGSSLRAVTGEAGVNLAAVNYHFGSKEELLRAVFRRRFGPMNQLRLEALDTLEARCAGGPPRVEEVLETFLRPLLEQQESSRNSHNGVGTRALVARLVAEPRHLLRPLLQEEFAEVARRYFVAMRRALPDVPTRELLWRFQFVTGAINQVIAEDASDQLPLDEHPPADTLQRMVAFLGAGLSCAVPQEAE